MYVGVTAGPHIHPAARVAFDSRVAVDFDMTAVIRTDTPAVVRDRAALDGHAGVSRGEGRVGVVARDGRIMDFHMRTLG